MFNKILKDLRLKHRYTQQELADKLEVTQRTIAFYEKGERQPDFNTLIKIAKIFDVSLDYLLGMNNKNLDSLNLQEYGLVIKKAKDANISAKNLEEIVEFIKKQKTD